VSALAPLAPDAILRNYFHAMDENRPHLLDRVFDDDAVLEVRNDTSTIAFPAITVGRDAIADVLVRSFGQTYENVYSFYLQRPAGQLPHFECDWTVAMTEKSTRKPRLGWGSYLWEFDEAAPNRVRRLTIAIAEMRVLEPTATQEVFAGIASLSYPWSSSKEVALVAPAFPVLAPLEQWLRARR
jgi:hypothetical protein